jgi:MFS family permease
MARFVKDIQYYKFGFYGFLKNLRLFEPFLILFFIDAGLSYLQIGILYGFREIARNIMEIPAGVIADATGRRRSMITSFTAYIFSFLMFFFAGSYTLFFAAMFLFAVGDAFRTGTHKAMIFDYLKLKGREEQKADYYGHTRAFSQFGSAISSLLSAALVFFTGNYRYIFLITVVPYIIDLFLLASYPAVLDGNTAKTK